MAECAAMRQPRSSPNTLFAEQCVHCRLESVWTVPSLDDDGNVVFPIGAYFTSVASAQRFYNLVNLRPQTIFSSSAGLYVSFQSPDLAFALMRISACARMNLLDHWQVMPSPVCYNILLNSPANRKTFCHHHHRGCQLFRCCLL